MQRLIWIGLVVPWIFQNMSGLGICSQVFMLVRLHDDSQDLAMWCLGNDESYMAFWLDGWMVP